MFSLKLDRRRFLKTGLALLAVKGTVFFGTNSCTTKDSVLSTNDNGSGNGVTLNLDEAANEPLREIGGAIKVSVGNSNNPLIVVRNSETKISALDSTCTHRSCEVSLPRGKIISCPCHGATFDLEGQRLSGPAPTGLRRYPAQFSNNEIVVTL